MVLAGALFKWPSYLFWLLLIPLAWRRQEMRQLAKGVLLSLTGLLPSLIWNLQHDFATFRHVFFTIYGKETIDIGTTALVKGNFAEFLGAQALLLSPILFLIFIAAQFYLLKGWKELNPALKFCASSSLAMLALHCAYACAKKMQGNWVDFIYPTAAVLLAWLACERCKRFYPWLLAGVLSSAGMVAVLFSLQQPFKYNLGWQELPKALAAAGYDPTQQFLIGDKYQTTSILSFYGPSQKRAYFLNVHQLRKNQFSYWPGIEAEQPGKDALLVAIEATPKSEEQRNDVIDKSKEGVQPYFDSVQFQGEHCLVSHKDKSIKSAFIFSCKGYNGQQPKSLVAPTY
jgi:hypothetical protein